jgi:hypothetical protein
MRPDTLRKIWITLATFCFVIMFNFYGYTQKSDVSLIIKLPIELAFEKELSREAYAVYGLRFFCLVFWLIPYLALKHANQSVNSFMDAFPFRLLDVDPNSDSGRTIQRVAFFVFIVLPFLSAIHMWTIVWNMKVCTNISKQTSQCGGIWSRSLNAGPWDHSYVIHAGGATYDPVVEPTIAILLMGFCIFLVCRMIFEMIKARSRGITKSNA